MAGAAIVAALWLTAPVAPALEDVRRAHRVSDVPLLDRHGAIVAERRTDPRVRRFAWVTLDGFAPAVREVLVAVEDHRFREHGGVDVWAVLGAMRDALRGRRLRGASTITMQVARLVAPPTGRSGFGRKWHEARMARALERRWTKDAILEAYLNLLPLRGELVGVPAASHVLFGKAPHGLGPAEAVVLAAMASRPNVDEAGLVARAAVAATMTTAPPAADAIAAVTRSAIRGTAPSPMGHPRRHLATRLLAHATEPVTSTIDVSLQEAAEMILERHVGDLDGGRVRDGAVLVVENASGDTLAYVGGTGARATAPHVDGVRARRQPGSTLKPFLYALALDRHLLTLATLLDDGPLDVPLDGGVYRPRDYDDRFRGLVSVRTALAASLNVPAVRVLGLLGSEGTLGWLRADVGLASLVQPAEHYGPGLALGAAEVTLGELVHAYRALARGGVAGAERERSDDPPSAGRRVMSAAAAWAIADVLADRESRAPTFGLDNPLATPFWAAVKTGTSTDMRDNWCIGFTDRYTVGVWVGHGTGAPMRAVSGVAGAAPIWLDLVRRLHVDRPSTAPAAPPELRHVRVRPGEGIEPERHEWFLDGTEPGPASAGLATAIARIITPAPDTIVAVDPDMPSERQRVWLRAEGVGAGDRWLVDAIDVGPAAVATPWPPTRGRHTIALVGPSGAMLDQIVIDVR